MFGSTCISSTVSVLYVYVYVCFFCIWSFSLLSERKKALPLEASSVGGFLSSH